jgi:hypothetical protein
VRVCGHKGKHRNKAHPRINWGLSDAERVATLEAERDQALSEIGRLREALKARVLEIPAEQLEALKAERDKLHAALAWLAESDVRVGCHAVSVYSDPSLDYSHDGTGPSIAAALIEARESTHG